VCDENDYGWGTTMTGFPGYGVKIFANPSDVLPTAPFHHSEGRLEFFAERPTYTAVILHPDGTDNDHWIFVVRQGSWWRTGLLLLHELLHWVAWYLPGEWLHDAIDYVPKRLRRNNEKA